MPTIALISDVCTGFFLVCAAVMLLAGFYDAIRSAWRDERKR